MPLFIDAAFLEFTSIRNLTVIDSPKNNVIIQYYISSSNNILVYSIIKVIVK